MKISESQNLTREQKLVQEIPLKGWLKNPAGRQGYAVIVLEQVGDGGTRFVRSLAPGQTLELKERWKSKFIVLAVDVRHGRSFPVGGQFHTLERGCTVTVQAKVRYIVTNPQIVAMEMVDPLGALRDKVISTLNDELARHSESTVNPSLIRRVICGVGKIPYSGLQIEDAEVLEFKRDSRITQQAIEEGDVRHKISIDTIQRDAEMVDLTDVKVFLNRYPELAEKVFTMFATRDQYLLQERMNAVKPAIQAYIEQKREIEAYVDPEVILDLLNAAATPPSVRIRLGPSTTSEVASIPHAEPPLLIRAPDSAGEMSTASESHRPRIYLGEEEDSEAEESERSPKGGIKWRDPSAGPPSKG